MKPAANVGVLNARINSEAGSVSSGVRLRKAVANTVLAQLLPPGAVKGGTAMKLRLGTVGSRFTPDFDVARHGTLEEFLTEFEENLQAGWGSFTGRLVARVPPKPIEVPTEYIMRPYDVKLSFKSKSWMTVLVELGHDELGDTMDPVKLIADDLVALFARLGLEEPRPAPVLAVHHQMAQKLHACTAVGSERAHDLVDLQLLVQHEDPGLALVAETAHRLFRSRRAHPWPPHVVVGSTWAGIYA